MTNGAPFQVLWLPSVPDALKNMSRKATPDVRKQLAEILRILDARLAADPLTLGEVYRKRDGIAELLAVHEFLRRSSAGKNSWPWKSDEDLRARHQQAKIWLEESRSQRRPAAIATGGSRHG